MSMRRRKLIGLLLAALALAGGVLIAVNFRRGAPPAATAPTPGGPLVEIQRPVLKHSEGEQLAWQIRLKQIQITSGQGRISAEGIQEALIYGASGAPLVRVTAQKVTGTTGGRDFAVTGHVTVVSYQGVVVSTDTVSWNQASGKIVCPGEVSARSKDALFSTTGLTYDINAAQITAPNQVNLYSGQNKILGKGLNYNLNSGDFSLTSIQMIFDAEEAKQLLGKVQTP
jgi:lipopolysaccharide assembly outer membrane protein LptD (OstA)